MKVYTNKPRVRALLSLATYTVGACCTTVCFEFIFLNERLMYPGTVTTLNTKISVEWKNIFKQKSFWMNLLLGAPLFLAAYTLKFLWFYICKWNLSKQSTPSLPNLVTANFICDNYYNTIDNIKPLILTNSSQQNLNNERCSLPFKIWNDISHSPLKNVKKTNNFLQMRKEFREGTKKKSKPVEFMKELPENKFFEIVNNIFC